MIRDSRRPDAGFTLIEVLISMVILSAGIIAVTNLFVVASGSNTVGNATTTAAAMASEHMDALKAAPYDDAALTAGSYTDPPRDVPGVGRVVTTWDVVDVGINTKFIRVRSEVQGGLAGARSRAEFTTFRSCTFQGPPANCP